MQNNIYTTMLKDIILASTNQDSLDDISGIFLVMSYTQFTLKDLLSSRRPEVFTEEHVKVILYNLLCSLNYFHSANLMHRDLKPANILLNKTSQVKLCDFGYSRSVPQVK